MPLTLAAEERRRLLARAQRLNTAALVGFGVVVLAAGAAMTAQPDRWWLFLIPLVLIAVQSISTLRRRHRIVAARSRVDAEGHQADASSATPESTTRT